MARMPTMDKKNNKKRFIQVVTMLWISTLLYTLDVSAKTVDVAADYPYKPVPFTKVKFTDSFWLPRMEINRAKTIPFAFKMCEDTHRIENFKIAGGLSEKKWKGDFGFNDSDVFKVLEGASYALMVKEDAELDKYLDEVISFIAAAQEDSGYLYTPWTARAKDHLGNISCSYNKEPWDNIDMSHELYNAGHMYEAAAAHYLATGKKSFLNVATKNADHICELFGAGKNEGVPGHQEIEIGLVKLYRTTGDNKYLKQAKWFLDQRGRGIGKGNAYAQQHIPVTDQREAVGHAVRANYMYSAMADVAALTGDNTFIEAIDGLWDNVANKKLYVTGGVGARHQGEAYGDDYELPNQTAYCETCAAIANVYWNHRMFLLHGQSKYIDVMERSLYNNVLSGVSLDGMKFFYPNPLESVSGNDRSPWFGCACCPSNICRFMASMPGYVYAVRNSEVYVNLFVDSKALLDIDESSVTLVQKTQYPWDGKIEIEVSPEVNQQSFVVNIRIPDWARNGNRSSLLYKKLKPLKEQVSIAINGENISIELKDGFVAIDRKWSKGDKISANLPMPAQLIECDKRVKDNIGKAAIQRGPIVYCIEWPDVEEGNVLNLLLEKDIKLVSEYSNELLGGITIVKGNAAELRKQKDSKSIEKTLREFIAIPYYAWSHRGKGPMAVWTPYDEKYATPLPLVTIASDSKVSTSFLSDVGINGTSFIQDQMVPKSSADHSQGYLHWWPHKGSTEWVQYNFKAPVEVSSVAVYWFDDTGKGECRIPKSWKLLYFKDKKWIPVDALNDYKVTIDDFDRISFVPVKTSSLKLEISFQDGFSSGIQEWVVE